MPLDFQPVTADSCDALHRFLPVAGNGDCNLTVAAVLAYARQKETHFAVAGGALLLRWRPRPETPMLFQAASPGALCPDVVAELETYALRRGAPLSLWGVVPELSECITRTMPYRIFTATTSNAWWDYLYEREALATLAGRKLNGKRNFAKRFHAAHPGARLLPIERGTIGLCERFREWWYAVRDMSDPGLAEERQGIATAFANFERLGLTGAVLAEGGEVFGFTYGAPSAPDIFCVHIEKADRGVAGAYPALAQGFAAGLPGTWRLLNREEDLGIPGLRKAKQDWAPARMLVKGYVTLQPEG